MENLKILRTDSKNLDFIQLVKLLDEDLANSDGEQHSFYDQYNKIDNIKHVLLAYENGSAIACGSLKEYKPNTMEIKRMYTIPNKRGLGIASVLLNELENWARELNCEKCILETGLKQPAAIALYQKNNYQRMPNYGQYIGVANSQCFYKLL